MTTLSTCRLTACWNGVVNTKSDLLGYHWRFIFSASSVNWNHPTILPGSAIIVGYGLDWIYQVWRARI